MNNIQSLEPIVNALLEIERTTPPEVMQHVQSVPNLQRLLVENTNVIFQVATSQIFVFSQLTPLGLTAYAFTKGGVLGQGTFGKVFAIDFIARSIINSINGLAIKESTDDKKSKRSIQNEYQMLSRLYQEKNVVGLQSPPILVKNSTGQVAYITKKFKASFDRPLLIPQLTVSDLQNMGCTLLRGLSFLHSHGVVHGDIKPANIFLEIDENGENRSGFADFGGACCIDNIDFSNLLSTFSPKYLSTSDLIMTLYFECAYAMDPKTCDVREAAIAAKAKVFEKHKGLHFTVALQQQVKEEYLSQLSIKYERSVIQKHAINLLQKRDVFALGMSLQQIFERAYFPIEIAESLKDLLASMKEPEYSKRIDSHEALARYQEILNISDDYLQIPDYYAQVLDNDSSESSL